MTGRIGVTGRAAETPAHGSGLPRADEIDAISLDLDDTLWPVMPTLIGAEHAMHQWLLQHAPATAAICSVDRMREIRMLVAMANADRAHDMSWLRLESLRQALRQGGDDPALAVGAFEVFLDGRQRVSLYDDVVPVLRRWRARYRLVAVTNGNADIDRIGIGSYFDATVAAHQLGVGKPDPRIFAHACTLLDVSPSRVLHVGDDLELDVRGARGAGLHAAWIRRPDLGEAEQERVRAAGSPEVPFSDLHGLDQALAD